MVAELHLRGYQLLRIAPGMSSPGHWRCSVTPASNISLLHGARLVEFNDQLVAAYTSGQGSRFFDWPDAARATPTQLADKFIDRFSRIAEAGRGSDWLYAGWYVDMLSRTYPDAFPIAYADWELPAEKMTTVGGREVDLPLPPPGLSSVIGIGTPQSHYEGVLELHPGHWVALEEYRAAMDGHAIYSPIRIDVVRPLKTGKSLLHLEMLRAGLAGPARHQSYDLRVLFRGRALLAGQQLVKYGHGDLLLIKRIDREWMHLHLPGWPQTDFLSVDDYLNHAFAPPEA